MTAIRHIVFDLGRVLLHWEPELPYRRLIPDDEARRRFLTEVCNATWLRETDLGSSWDEAERRLIERFPDHAEMIRAFRRNWHEMVPDTIADTPEILAELLAAGYDVTALTNFAEDTYEEALERFPLLGSFRGVTVSAHAQLIKPDEAIFHHHAEVFGLTPSATLFFDDIAVNVAAARRAGWNAEQFIDAAKMRADLRRYGINFD